MTGFRVGTKPDVLFETVRVCKIKIWFSCIHLVIWSLQSSSQDLKRHKCWWIDLSTCIEQIKNWNFSIPKKDQRSRQCTDLCCIWRLSWCNSSFFLYAMFGSQSVQPLTKSFQVVKSSIIKSFASYSTSIAFCWYISKWISCKTVRHFSCWSIEFVIKMSKLKLGKSDCSLKVFDKTDSIQINSRISLGFLLRFNRVEKSVDV